MVLSGNNDQEVIVMVDKKFANLKEELEGLRKNHKNIETHVRKLEEKILELYTLYSISKTLSLTHQLEDLFNGTMELLGDALGIDEFCLMLLHDNELIMKVAHGMKQDIAKNITFRLGEGVSGKVAKSGKAVLIDDVSKNKDFLYYKGLINEIGSFMSVPLKSDDKVIGVLNIHRPDKDAFKKHDLDFFEAVADHVAVAIEKARIFEKTKEDAAKDELTELYNRRFFFEKLGKEMKRSKRYKKVFSIVMVDLDHFKAYNDLCGHIRGDNALRQAARLLQQSLRGEDVVARFGGEEFILLLPEIGKDDALKAAEKLRKSIEEDKFKGEELLPGGRLTASFGIAAYPEDGEEGLQLIDAADKALYLSKHRGRNMVFSSNDLPR